MLYRGGRVAGAADRCGEVPIHVIYEAAERLSIVSEILSSCATQESVMAPEMNSRAIDYMKERRVKPEAIENSFGSGKKALRKI
jgi:hypothetical protein